MYDFTPSEYYRSYCKKNGIEITDRSLAAAILNEDLEPVDGPSALLEDKLTALKKIAAETGDNELKASAAEVIENIETAWDNLKKGDKNSIYKVENSICLPLEDDLYTMKTFYFYDFDTAFNYALYHTEEIGGLYSFDIERLKVFTGNESPKTAGRAEHAYFDRAGNLLRIYCGKKTDLNDLYSESVLVNPFNALDIVTHYRSGELGIVKGSDNPSRGRTDVFIEYGYVWEVNPMCLEKIDSSSEPAVREKAVEFIRKWLGNFNDKEREVLEKTIAELSGE